VLLNSLHIEGFRAFERLDVEGLARVNLFIGPNNAGKTTVLEAVQVLLAGDPRLALAAIARRRGELLPGPRDVLDESRREPLRPDANPIFHHPHGPERTAVLQGAGAPAVRLDFGWRTSFSPESWPFSLGIEREGERAKAIGLSEAGAMGQILAEDIGVDRAVFATPGMAARTWSTIAITPEEDRVVAALQVLEPQVDRIGVISRGPGTSSFVVKLRDPDVRLPLGSLGEGMTRLLDIACALVTSGGKVLLIDDVDTGLHHRVLGKVWKLVLETARRLDVQVFATTHSLDCLEELTRLVNTETEYASEVAVFRVEKGKDKPVRFDANTLRIAYEHEIELRG
jgi:hypothetical protein